MTYLLDTNICIYALKNRPPEVLKRLEAVGRGAVALSVITVLELRQGAEKSQRVAENHSRLDFFLAPMKVLPFEEEAAVVAARIRAHLERREFLIGDLDTLIAAHAMALDLILVTNNLDEFERVPGLRTTNWVG
ncbi:MAG TPA: type II toxin-antitoxin system VapC family toxin [Thermoanaerobaculia bacterium]|nr:type II toxin-antitoxin system VapC family toxin [Thermoanaerobaculia bacterium]